MPSPTSTPGPTISATRAVGTEAGRHLPVGLLQRDIGVDRGDHSPSIRLVIPSLGRLEDHRIAELGGGGQGLTDRSHLGESGQPGSHRR